MTYAREIKRHELTSFAEGEKTEEKKKETMMILAMLRKGFSAESIAECAQTSVEYITELGKKHHLRRLQEQASFFVRYDREF